jgi:4'-phosphopantetheinyl transferase
MKPRGSATPLASPGWGAFEVGVDCEDELRRTSAAADKLAGRWLSPLEHDALKAIGDDTARAASFMRTWTLKESYVKALGTGIAAHPFGRFDVSFGNGEVRGSSPVGSEGGRITLTERSGTSDAERRAWAATERRWRMALLKPRGDDSLLIAVCAHAAVDEDEDEVREGLGSCGMNVRVRWTVPVVGDVADGARPPPELIARTEGFGALE